MPASPRPAITAAVAAPPEGDAILLPTDSYGTPGRLNGEILRRLGLPPNLPGQRDLEPGYALRPSDQGLIVFVVTVASQPTATALRHNLAQALGDPRVRAASSLWVPLLGTGAGKLPDDESFAIILEALEEHPPIQQGRATAVISLPETTSKAARERIMAGVAAAAERFKVNIEAISEPGPTGEQPSAASSEPNDDKGPTQRKPGKKASSPRAPRRTSDSTSADASRSSTRQRKLDAYKLPRTAAVDSLLAFGTSLARYRGDKYRSVTTSLLFFALAESGSDASPVSLHGDNAAETFASVVQELAGERYADGWQEYFERPRISEMDEIGEPFRPTTNVTEVLEHAHGRAGASGIIGLDQLIAALLEHPEARLRVTLKKIGVDPAQLLEAYRDARVGRVTHKFQNDVANSEDRLDYERYASAIHRFLTDKDTLAPLSISIQAPWGGGKSTLMHLVREALDPEAARDKYKRMPLADLEKLPKLLLRNVTELLGKRIKVSPDATDKEDETARRWTVWFNAWKYDTTEQLWAGLVDAIVSQTAMRLSPLEREKFLLKLQLARVDDGIIRKRIYDRVANLWWGKAKAWVFAAATAVVSLFGYGAIKPALPDWIQQVVSLGTGNGFAGAIVTQVVLSAGVLISYLVSKSATKSEPAKFSLSDFIKVPDYDKGVGELHHAHADLRRVLEVVPHIDAKGNPTPLVIFIDDLDRCSPGKVASVVEGVSMLLATDEYRCMFVIGMDPQMVAAALEKAHEDVRKQLPRYERAVPLGWRFMDKFVQLPFTLPPSDPDAFNRYVAWLAGEAPPTAASAQGGGPTQANTVDQPATTRSRRAEQIDESSSSISATFSGSEVNLSVGLRRSSTIREDEIEETRTEVPPELPHVPESRSVGAIIRRIASYSVSNPREMKRMVNLARFYLTLRNARRDADTSWNAPDADQYARWIVLTLRWPDMLRWLQWGADEAQWPPEDAGKALAVRRLSALEAHAADADRPDDWCTALKSELNLPTDGESNWTRDAKLFEFFKAEASLPVHRRLSEAAAQGFW